jgi:hypothetical protein
MAGRPAAAARIERRPNHKRLWIGLALVIAPSLDP